VFCQSIGIDGAPKVVADAPAKEGAIGDKGLSVLAIGTLALGNPAIGDSLLSEPAWGTLTALGPFGEVRGPATSSLQERNQTEQRNAKNILTGEEMRLIGARPQWEMSP
jgi:hypothetical protein